MSGDRSHGPSGWGNDVDRRGERFYKNAESPEAINHQDRFHGKAIWTFLEYPNYWVGVTSNLYVENIPDASWKKRNDLPRLPPHVEPEDTDRIRNRLG